MAELVCGTGDREAWLAARREGITATDIAVILGLVTWDSPFALYWRKKGKLPEVEQTDRMRLGSWLEEAISGEWIERNLTGDLLIDYRDRNKLYRSAERHWQMATPDAPIRNGAEEFAAVLECKTSATRDGWGSGEQTREHGPSSEFCEECSTVPAHVRAQVLWQMDTLGVGTGHVAVCFLPSGEFRSYTIGHNHASDSPETAQTLMCPACDDIQMMRVHGWEFWRRLQDGAPPPVDGLQVTTDALRHLNAGAVKGKRAEVDLLLAGHYQDACNQLDAAKRRKAEEENLLRQAMGDATLAVFGETVIARREVFKRAGYEVGPAEVDRLVRVKPKEGKSDE